MSDIRVIVEAAVQGSSIAYGIMRIGGSLVGIPLDFLSEVCQISALRQLLVKSATLLGGLDLRGHLIPVIDLPRICGFDDAAQGSKFAVVLRHEEEQLAFLVDEVVGITQIDGAAVQTLHVAGAPAASRCVRGIFLDKDRLVSVADVAAIFAQPGIFSVKPPRVAQTHMIDKELVSMLTFAAGGARFSIRATDVYGTVPQQTIEVNSMTSGYCLGAITYHQRRVPVLSTVDVMGIGRRIERTSSEVVVLRCPDDRLLGLAVDAIEDIQAMDARRNSVIPGPIARLNGFLSDVYVKENGSQVYVIATERLIQDPSVAAVASLSSHAVAKTEPTVEDRSIVGNTRHLIERYLVFQVGRTIAVPLAQVTCIITPPKALVPATEVRGGLLGYFPRAHESIPLVDLNAHLGLQGTATDSARVLLTGSAANQVGFQVERIFGIETSSWILKGLSKDGPGSENLVQLGSGEGKRVLPVIDLEAIAAQNFVMNLDVTRVRTPILNMTTAATAQADLKMSAHLP